MFTNTVCLICVIIFLKVDDGRYDHSPHAKNPGQPSEHVHIHQGAGGVRLAAGRGRAANLHRPALHRGRSVEGAITGTDQSYPLINMC